MIAEWPPRDRGHIAVEPHLVSSVAPDPDHGRAEAFHQLVRLLHDLRSPHFLHWRQFAGISFCGDHLVSQFITNHGILVKEKGSGWDSGLGRHPVGWMNGWSDGWMDGWYIYAPTRSWNEILFGLFVLVFVDMCVLVCLCSVGQCWLHPGVLRPMRAGGVS